MGALFQPGDPVRVQNGDGREMMVEGYDPNGQVVCSFWEGVSRIRAGFPEAALEKLPPLVEEK